MPEESAKGFPSLTAIVPSHNGGELILSCVETLLSQLQQDDSLVVVDNGSRDGSADQLSRIFGEHLKILHSRRALGFARACNRGAEAATTDLLLFVNQDLMPDPGCLDTLRREAMRYQPAILGVKLLGPEGRIIQHLGGIILANGMTRHRGRHEQDMLAMEDDLLRCDYVTGALFLVRRHILEQLGGFDVRFSPAYFEEADFCVRAANTGVMSLVIPWASARHFEAQTSGPESLQYHFRYQRNRLRFVLKHYTTAALKDIFLPAEKAWYGSALSSHARRGARLARAATIVEMPRWLVQRLREPPTFVPQEVMR